MKQPDMNRLTSLFGSSAEIARIAGVTTSAVARWGRYKIAPTYQRRLIIAADDLGLDRAEVAHAAGVEPCPACGAYHVNGKRI
jgi:hypothetical protein